MRRGYAVLDFETTGLSPKRGDRILEVGAVYMNADLTIDRGIETLVNPQRDVGPTHVHGVTARDVFDAPTFDQIAPALLDMLDGRVIVGHNISFDLRFLVAELEREGYEVPEIVAIDTMQVARTLLKQDPPPSFKLHDLSAHLGYGIREVFDHVGLDQRPEHSAFGDALVTAYVLGDLQRKSCTSAFWTDHLDRAERLTWPERYPVDVAAKRRGEQPLEESALAQTRTTAAPAGGGTIAAVLTALGARTPAAPATAAYTGLLDAALQDRVLDAREVDALVESASVLGLDTVTLGSLHRGHFDGVVRAAWGDGVLSDHERADILRLAELLGIDDDSLRDALCGEGQLAASSSPPPVPASVVAANGVPGTNTATVPPGGVVVLTGALTVERDHVEARLVSLGYVIGANVTKKTALLIAADPYTQSGKAKKARLYGVPVLGESEGLGLLGY